MKHLLNRVPGWDAMGSLPTGWCHPQGGRRCSGNMGPSGESVDMRAARCRQAQRERAQWFQSGWTWPGKPRGAGLGGILTAGGEAGKTWGGTEGRQLGRMGQWVGGTERGLEVASHTRTSPSSKTVGEEVCFRRWGAPPPAPPAHSSASCPPEAVLLTPLPTPTSRQAPAQLQPPRHSPGPSPRPHPCELCSGAPDTVAAPAHTAAPATCR